MPIHSSLPVSFTPDVIIAGGGTSGCVLAGRLARATPRLTILLLEAGLDNRDDYSVVRPALYMHHQVPLAPRLKTYTATSSGSSALDGRVPNVPCGHGLGGGSSVNFTMYTRASASDYNDWKMPGWSADELVPLLKKLENCTYTDGPTHGKGGPVDVSFGGFTEETIMSDCEAAVRSLGYEVVEDANDLKTGNAFQRWAKYIDPATGRRSDAAHRYVHAALDEGFDNLHVLCNTTVSRVLLAEDGTATGVEIVPTCATPFSTATPPAPTTVLARKLVVVSGGALGTPLILERSGIGASSVLLAAGVTPQIDLPGVGSDYQDHNLLLPVFEVRPDILTHDLIFRGDTAALSTAEEAFSQGRGHLASNTIDFAGKVRPTAKQLAEMPADFQEHYSRVFAQAPDKPLAVIVPINALLAGHENFPPDTRYVTVAIFSSYPISRGYVHISSPSAYAHPFIDPRFLVDDRDVPPLVWAYKIMREMMRRTRCCIGEISSPNPGERYERSGEDWTPESVPETVYTEEENKNIEMWVRRNIVTTWHSLGTCAMKPREEGGVVDSKLRVYGTQRLMLADLSIAPGNVGSNTNNTALMIGEKAAVLAAEYLGIEL